MEIGILDMSPAYLYSVFQVLAMRNPVSPQGYRAIATLFVLCGKGVTRPASCRYPFTLLPVACPPAKK